MKSKIDGKNEIPGFGKKITLLRKGLQLTQEQMAEKLGISLEMMRYYERRCKNPTMEFIQKAASAFGITTDELIFGNTKKKTGPTSRLEQQIEELKKLPVSKQKIVSDMIDAVVKS